MADNVSIEIATELSKLAMQAWGFHITGALAVTGWAATTRSRGSPGLPNVGAGLVAATLFGFLFITGYCATYFGNAAFAAVTTAQTQFQGSNPEVSELLTRLANSNGCLVTVLIVQADLFAVGTTGLLLSQWRRE